MTVDKTKYDIRVKIEELNHQANLLRIDLEEWKFKKDNLIWFNVYDR